jgi:dihydrofolate reductase
LAAVTVDGFIARDNGDTDWVKDDELLEKTAKEFGCAVMGHNTYKEYRGPAFEGVQHLVLAKDAGLDVKYPNVTYVSSPAQAVQKAKDLDFKKLLIIGGGKCNGSFAAAGLLNEIWLDIHPLVLGEGIKLLGDFTDSLELKIVSSKQHDNFVHCQFMI